MEFNKKVVDRFVKDWNLPIPVINEVLFDYHLDLYEYEYMSRTLYNTLCGVIQSEFGGDVNAYMQYEFRLIDDVMKWFTENESFKLFNSCDMSRYSVKDVFPKTGLSKTVYNEINIGKMFVSVDLSQANFQALKYANPAIVMNKPDWNCFMREFTNISYFRESKHLRQVIMGQANPARHITVEKHIISKIYEYLMENVCNYHWHLINVASDELVFEFTDFNSDDISKFNESLKIIENSLKDELGFNVHTEFFTLKGYDFNSEATSKHIGTFYCKEFIGSGKRKFKSIPLPYHSVLYKLVNGIEVNGNDMHFEYGGMDCIFNEGFTLKEIV